MNLEKYEIGLSYIIVTKDVDELKLLHTINSIIRIYPKGADYEIIIKEGGESTYSIPKSNNIRFIKNPDKGIYHAMNQSIDFVKYSHCFFINTGDIISNYPSFEFSYNDNFIYYTKNISDDGELKTPKKINSFFLMRNALCHQSLIYPTKVIKRHYYDTKYRVLADHELTLKLFFSGHEFRFTNSFFCTPDEMYFSKINYQAKLVERHQIINNYYKDKKLMRFFYYLTAPRIRIFLIHKFTFFRKIRILLLKLNEK